ncbi:hypothetical protein Francci3_1799 [Frankia casuarinae]|uniref:Uncharacterized protein n=1 Tax=Frankia casuarinae (strain DSM 45818 / CECT 9043 / HFP020203 / CcI3) TaxID=106370 RepID=Q2JC17_FRACC|nr:hypothetical protein Francci3_1799 [Frankia casuarinae]
MGRALQGVGDHAGRPRPGRIRLGDESRGAGVHAGRNHPGISGQAARHARMPGTPSKTSAMDLAEGQAFVRRVVLAWIAAESN